MTDAVAACLAGLTTTGLEITSGGNGLSVKNHPGCLEKIIAYIPIGPDASGIDVALEKIETFRQFLARACLFFPDCPAPQLHTEIIPEEDWGAKWKKFFTTFQVTPKLTIKPSWEAAAKPECAGEAQPEVIEMDPGLAFGTGHHPSTKLALLLLEELFQDPAQKTAKVLDVGTGSGILAMACGLYGAKEVLALDNDSDAVETSRRNIRRNGLEGRVTVSSLGVKALHTGFDIVVANITHDILAELAETLTRLIHPLGFLVLAGILKGNQEQSLKEVYRRQGLSVLKSLTIDEWAALLLQKI